MDDPTTAQAFMNETVALQSYLASLQRELTDGLSRVSRIVDLAVKAGLLPESSTAMPFPTSGVNPIIDRYQYHSQIIPVVPQVATPRALSTLVPELPPTVIATPEPDLVEISNQIPEITVIPTHVAIGLKWESQDYIDASKLDLETKKTEDLNPKPEGSSSKLSAMLSGSMKNVSIYLSSNTIGSLPMYNTDNKVSPDPAEVKESSDTLSPDLLMPYVPISIIEPEPEPLRSRRQSNEDKSPGARRRSSGQLSTFMEHRRPSMISRVPEEVSEATNKGTAKKAKWEKLRRQTMRDSSQIKGRKLSAVIQAAFPEIQRQNEAKKEHAKKNWEKLRGVVFAPKTVEKKNPKLAELMVSVLPDIETLHKKIHTPVIQEKKMTPYNSFSSFLHWFFLCPAFDEKGQYISIAKYHGSDYRKHRFYLDGFNPMSIFYSSMHLLLILFFIVILLLQPYQAAYYDNVQTQLALSWIISATKTDAQFKVKRPILSIWIPNYLKSHGIVDLITIVPWVQVLPLSLLILLRIQRLPSMMARSPLFIIIHARIESIGGIGNILARIIPVGLLVIVFIHIQACCIYYVGRLSNFSSWNQQFDHWVHYVGGVEASSVFERYIWMLSQAIGNTFPLTFKPETVSEQVVTIVFILLGAILYATFVGLISSAAISFDASGKLYRQKIDELTDYLTWKNSLSSAR
ncbi:hypothetical protein BCR33DRAFT_710965 [Rhizoclosmatium globosum]|uniref:Ion transport domain-containing protein n=1 Tax=Rhizoclosmatium globosum TaxID=329046 RepID=A0A1Y2D376_9FUNG|nr:hypothetical protein BCR33DRAFT_710965 [Rhizoclosmatium globosum]|eukprot:ORY53566.1 hypothetical protein BCR33DRAFT_710965 [Rhizoclosmatium globosum]